MRILFMGSPAEVINPLKSLIKICEDSPKHKLIGVVSQCARPVGRKRILQDPPLAAFAKEYGLNVWQPEKASSEEFLTILRHLAPDLVITAAYGQILSEEFLSIPRRATINIHPSLLPSYRGATPVQSALLDGLKTTGLSILFSVKALDAGSIIFQEKTDVAEEENAQELMQRLFNIGANALDSVISLLEDNNYRGVAQDPTEVTHCKKIQKEDGRIHWTDDAETSFRKFKAYTPWPGVYAFFEEKRICFEHLKPVKKDALTMFSELPQQAGEFVLQPDKSSLIIKTFNGYLSCEKVKLQGCKSSDALAFCNRLKGKKTGLFS